MLKLRCIYNTSPSKRVINSHEPKGFVILKSVIFRWKWLRDVRRRRANISWTVVEFGRAHRTIRSDDDLSTTGDPEGAFA